MKKNNLKAQIWFMDFVIAILIFTFMLIGYYTYTTNISKQDSVAIADLIADAKAISSSSTTGGYPDNWDVNNVVRIGFTDDNNRINNDKFNEFTKINYNKSLKLFGTVYDYFTFFFVNESGDVQNVEGFCGVGHPAVNVTYDINAAYYHKDETKLRDFMIDNFQADIYKDSPADVELNELLNNIDNNKYGLVVIESPEFNTNQFNTVKASIEPWVISGGFFMLSGRPLAAQGGVMLGVKFYKVTGDAGRDKPATVIKEDELIVFDYADQIMFKQVYYIEDVSLGSDLIDIARFNESDVEIEDMWDNKIALARWPYGEGKVLFFSDFDATYLAGDFQENLESSTAKWIGARCLPINMINIKRDNLVRVDRLLIYNSKIVKMVLYVWQ